MADNDSRSGAAYHDKAILEWVDGLHHPHDGGLAYAFGAPERHGMPAIQVGRGEGALLGMLLRLAGAREVVEVGTLAAYSTIHLARAVGPTGHVWSIEYDMKHAGVAREVKRAAQARAHRRSAFLSRRPRLRRQLASRASRAPPH